MITFPDEGKKFYTSANEAIECEIIPALGDYVDDFDVVGIFENTFMWDEDERGFFQEADEDEFWRVVEAHDISDK